ncbi:late histone H2B.L4-like [Amyelois transitella]|uniref:late histone H2B.L4-like n=1 Tax=Amyelois transitella TaxID=680683 RepID=UPI00067AB500|nr:late histone H2B.L4-like [Amyelois transitella]
MAPSKPPKVLKPIAKPLEKPISKKMKKKKKNYDSFDIYIYKLLRSVAPENIRISRKSMLIMNNAVNDLLERFAVEAGRLVAHGKKTTMGSREIQSAVKLLLPGELAKHANMEALKAVTLYHNSVTKPPAQT